MCLIEFKLSDRDLASPPRQKVPSCPCFDILAEVYVSLAFMIKGGKERIILVCTTVARPLRLGGS